MFVGMVAFDCEICERLMRKYRNTVAAIAEATKQLARNQYGVESNLSTLASIQIRSLHRRCTYLRQALLAHLKSHSGQHKQWTRRLRRPRVATWIWIA